MARRERDLDYFMSLSYPVVIAHDAQEGHYYADVPDLPGCLSEGRSPGEAYRKLQKVKRLWLETALEEGIEIAQPSDLVKKSSAA